MDFENVSVLIVEKDEVNKVHLSSKVRNLGVSDVDACFIEEAMAALSKKTYHLVLININLTTLSGLNLIKMMRSSGDPTVANVYIVAISASDQREVRFDSIEGGADAFLSKPVCDDDLHLNILPLLRRA